MAGYRKLGRTSSQRKALLRNQVTNLLYHGKIVTTEAKAKEIRKIAEKLIAMAVKEKDNYETVTVKAKVAQKDKDGNPVKDENGKDVIIKANLSTFSATFVNIIGGTIGGNLFGGGYYGAIYGTSHVHMGWNAMMPDGDTRGDCHYYNNYGDGNFGGDSNDEYAILPFDKNNQKALVSNLFINGSVYAGGDRGSPDGKVSYDFVTIYGNSHILLNGTGYAAGTNVYDPLTQMAAMYVKGSLFGSGNSCSAFYDTPAYPHFITIKNYQAVEEGTNFPLYSIQRASTVTLIHTKLRLAGRADGANANPTALYSLNYIYSLVLQSSSEGSSQIILDAPTKDLRKITSQEYDGSINGYKNTTADKPYNIIQLNGGIVLEVKEDSGNPREDYGPVQGYFYLDVNQLSYYSAYVYGQRQVSGVEGSATGGFVYGNSFYGVSFGEVGHTDSIVSGGSDYNNLKVGYRAWMPVGGGGHLTASTTVVATNGNSASDPSDSTKTVYLNEGSVTLPMAEAGSKYRLVGYNIYPTQIASLTDPDRSLKLVTGEKSTAEKPNGFTGSDKNSTFKLKISPGEGFDKTDEEQMYLWFTDSNDSAIGSEDTWKTTGAVLPQFDLELYSQGVTRTAVAGNVVLTVQEMKPIVDADGKETYAPGNEINIVIVVETQSGTLGDKVTDDTSDRYGDGNNYQDSTTLYVNSLGKYSLQYIIPSIDNNQYTLTLKTVKLTQSEGRSDFTLVGNPKDITNKNQYAISIKANDVKNREGWHSNSMSEEKFLTEADLSSTTIGTTDGRYQAGILITLYSKTPDQNTSITDQDYPAGTITFEIEYSNDSSSGSIYIDNKISTQREIYTVSFVPGQGAASIPSKRVSSGDTLNTDNSDFVSNLSNNPPLKEGETFAKWVVLEGYTPDANGNLVPKLGSDFNLKDSKITGNTTLYAVYKHSVVFHFGYNNSDGNENITTLDVDDNTDKLDESQYKGLNTNNRPGYEFVGWYTDKTFTTPFKNENITESIDVYAKWDAVKYTIKLDKNNNDASGSVTDMQNLTLDNPVINLPTSGYELTGKSLGGWSLEKDAASGGVFSINLNDYIDKAVDNVITLYAVWVDDPVIAVSLDKTDTSAEFWYSTSNDGTTDSWTEYQKFTGSFTAVLDTYVKIKCKLTDDGKYNISNATYNSNDTPINGTDTDGTVVFNLGQITSNQNNLVIHLKGLIHTVKLDAGTGGKILVKQSDGTSVEVDITSISVIYGKTFAEVTYTENGTTTTDTVALSDIAAARDGYKFKHWYLGSDPNLKTKINDADKVNIADDNQTLIASYEAVSYGVMVTTGSNVSILINTQTIAANTTDRDLGKIASQDAQLQFYVYLPEGYTQTTVSNILTIEMKNAGTFVPLTSDQYSVSKSPDGTYATVEINANVIKNDIKITLNNATLNTYSISGIVSDNLDKNLSNITVNYTIAGVPKSVTTDDNGKYTISGVPHGATGSISINQWGYDPRSQDVTVTSDQTVNMALTKNLTVTYNLNGGTGTAPTDGSKYAPGDSITLNTDAQSRTGYTFGGWATSNGTAIKNSYAITSGDSGKDPNFKDNEITFYAVWTANKYIVSYDANNGSGNIEDGSATYDQNFTLSDGTGFSKEGYKLVKWNTAADGSGTDYDLGAIFKWSLTSNLTLYAVWEEITYLINVYDYLNNKDANVTTVDYNAYLIKNENLLNPANPPLDKSKYIKLNFNSGRYYTANVPAGTYHIFFLFGMEDVDADNFSNGVLSYTNTPFTVTANSITDSDGGTNHTEMTTVRTVNVMLYSVEFSMSGVTTDGNSSFDLSDQTHPNGLLPSYTSSGLPGLLVVSGALPYQYNMKLYAPNTLPTSDDYYFDGWYVETSEGSGEYKEWNIADSITEKTTVYAKWVSKTLTVKFNDDKNSDVYSGFNLSNSKNNITFYRGVIKPGTTAPVEERITTDEFNTFNWYDSNDGTVSVSEIKNAGTYYLKGDVNHNQFVTTYKENEIKDPFNSNGYTVTLPNYPEINAVGDTESISGSAEFTITPYTGTITIIPAGDGSNLEYIYNGDAPDLKYTAFIDDDDDGTFDERTDYKLTDDDLNNFIKSYASGDTSLKSAPVNVGSYKLTLTANSAASNFYSSDTSKGASGSIEYTINKLAITITPVDDQWKYYGDNLNHIYTGINPPTVASSSKDYVDYKVTFIDANGNSVMVDYGVLGAAYGSYVNYSRISGNLKIIHTEDKSQTLTKFDPVNGSYSYSIDYMDADSNSNYTINLDNSKNHTFEVKPLPITIKPDDGQWKFYGDLDDQIYTGDYTLDSSPDSIKYTITATINGTSTEDLTPEQWSKNYSDYSTINVTVSYDGATRFIDAGSYDTNCTGTNPNYDVKIYADPTTNEKIKFTVKPLPIFIVPLADQWKYYGYDLTDPSKIDTTDNSISCIFIGENGTDSLIKSNKLRFDTYDFRSINIQNTNKLEFAPGTYKTLDGILYSKMLEKASNVRGDENVQVQYGFDISHLTKLNGTGANINTNYDIWDINRYNEESTHPVPYSNEQSSSDKIILGAGNNDLSVEYFGTISPTPATLTWSGISQTYDGTDQSGKVIASYSDVDGKTQNIPSELLSFVGSDNVTQFLVAGSYTVTADVSSLTNYDFGTDTTSAATMSQKPLTITLNGLTAEYNGTNSFTFTIPNDNISVSDLASGDTITKIKIETMKNGTASADAGTYTTNDLKVTLTVVNNLLNDRLNCYDVSLSNSFTITQYAGDLTVTLDSATEEYNGKPYAPSIQGVEDSNGNTLSADDYSLSWNPSGDKTSAGTYTLTVTGKGTNYASSATGTATFTITDKEVFTITFDSNGGSSVEPVDVVKDSKIEKPENPTKSGYTFKGWYKDAALETEWDFDKDVVTADITLYAKWETKDPDRPTYFKVEYNANGGEGEVPKSELHFSGEFVTVKSSELSKNGYIFKGWCDSFTQQTYLPDEEFRMPNRNVCLTAVWEESSPPTPGKEVTVTFVVDNAFYGESKTHINTSLGESMQPDPVKEGYDFAGWYTEDDQVFTADSIVKGNMTVYADFKLNKDYVIVTFVIDNEIYLEKVCRKDNIQEPVIPYKLGKELNAWYLDRELQNKFSFDSVVSEDHITLYAEWKQDENVMIWLIFILFAAFMAAVIASAKRVSFFINENDEEKYASVIMFGKGTLGDRLPQIPDDQNFSGWYSESGELITEESEITQSMKVYAHWKE